MWLNLESFLPYEETNGAEWEAERLFNRRMRSQGVIMAVGEAYGASKPGRFRLVIAVEEYMLREGIERFL